MPKRRIEGDNLGPLHKKIIKITVQPESESESGLKGSSEEQEEQEGPNFDWNSASSVHNYFDQL